MSRFFVGQRVRLVRACQPENVGLEGRIVMFGYFPKGTISCGFDGGPVPIKIHCDCLVHYDGDARECFESTDRLEPIQPLGAAPSELSYTELMDRCRAGEVECV